jgi:hypothetical protein
MVEKEMNFNFEDIYGNKYKKNDKNHTKNLLDETSSHIDDDKQFSCSYFCNRLFNYFCFFLY